MSDTWEPIRGQSSERSHHRSNLVYLHANLFDNGCCDRPKTQCPESINSGGGRISDFWHGSFLPQVWKHRMGKRPEQGSQGLGKRMLGELSEKGNELWSEADLYEHSPSQPPSGNSVSLSVKVIDGSPEVVFRMTWMSMYKVHAWPWQGNYYWGRHRMKVLKKENCILWMCWVGCIQSMQVQDKNTQSQVRI